MVEGNGFFEVAILTLGPLANLVIAEQKFPDLPNLIDEVVVMGGNAFARGNASPATEANTRHSTLVFTNQSFASDTFVCNA